MNITGKPGCGLYSVAVIAPPGGISGAKVVVTLEESCRAVDEFSDDVGVASVPLGLCRHMHKDVMQRECGVGAPPWHLSHCIEWQLGDGCVGKLPRTLVEIDDVILRFVRCCPQVRVGFRGFSHPRKRQTVWTTERHAEV